MKRNKYYNATQQDEWVKLNGGIIGKKIKEPIERNAPKPTQERKNSAYGYQNVQEDALGCFQIDRFKRNATRWILAGGMGFALFFLFSLIYGGQFR